MFIKTRAYRQIARLKKRIRAISGGTAASKTVSILVWLIGAAQGDKIPTLTSVVSESFPHLKRGVMRDFLSILELHDYYDDNRWNKTDFVYTFETGSKIEFFSADQPGKVRGPRRDRLFINEANNVPYEVFDQLEVRTNDIIFLDWNPVSEFWFYSEVQKRNDVDFLKLTYRDNEALNKDIIAAIEQRRDKANWWKVYGEGELGELEGKIYKSWNIIDEIPHEARLERYGIDFGYTNDPTVIVAVYYWNGGYIVDELLYQNEISNKQIADLLNNVEKALVIADSAEPKSIAEIRSFGINIQPCQKGADSIRHGIKLVQDQKISLTKRSVNLLKEYRNYMWEVGKDGVAIPGIPIAIWNHGMDAIRYAFGSLINVKRRDEYLRSLPIIYDQQRPTLNPAR